MICRKCGSQDIGPTINSGVELINQCLSCGYWFDRAADGPEVEAIKNFSLLQIDRKSVV